MSFETGTTALLICPLSKALPGNFLDLLSKYTAGRLDDVKDEPQLGWVSGRHLLDCEISERTALCGGHLYVNLRKAERKVPPALLNAICKREELAYMQANDSLTVPRKERMRIKEDAVENNLMKIMPTISATPVLVDRVRNVLYLGTGSLKQFDVFVIEFCRAIGTECEPVPVSPDEFMLSLFHKSMHDLPMLNFAGEQGTGDEPMPGRDFLTWLWYFSEMHGGRLELPGLGEFTVALEGPLTFAFSPEKAKDPELAGSGESTVKKGNPLTSAEAKSALASGKKLRKAKVHLARSDAEKWSFTFDADSFAFGSLSLPEGEEMELNARLEERVGFLATLHDAMKGYFKTFAESLMGKDLANTEKSLRNWTKDRESL